MTAFKKPKTADYNLIVIGAGSAGLVCAYIAATVKAKVLLIEKHRMGGDCLNTGCVPSKALIRSARVKHMIDNAAAFGLEANQARVNFAAVMERVQKVIKTIEPHDSVERYQSLGMECLQGEAIIVSPYEVKVAGKSYTTRNIIIASGASPLIPPIPGLKEIDYLSSDNLWELRELPKQLLVMGAGPIGCELAQSFQRLGSSVTLVDMAPRVMPREDSDISDYMQKVFTREGIKVLVGHKMEKFFQRDGRDWAALSVEADSQANTVEIPFDKVLVAVGRKANSHGLGLESIGVETTKPGLVKVDDYLRTNFKNIFACGDITGPYQFTHTASHQAWYAAVNALFGTFKKFKVDYSVIPWATFTDPEVARVGLNEADAKEKGIAYEITQYGIDDLDRAIADSENQGFIKVLTAPGSDKVLGATIVGYHASELITEFISAMKHNIGLNKILGTIHIYPTLSEANKFLAGNWKRNHAPQGLLKFAEMFHGWRR
jgi:dihydrolipoamide dehydrogenase